MDLLCQGVGVLAYRLDSQFSVGLVDADCPPGADTVAMEEDHNLAYLHPFLPGIGNLLTALWPDSVNRLQVGGVVANHRQHFGAKVPNQLFRQYGTDTLHEAAAQVPLNALARGRWHGLQHSGFELEPMLFVPYPPSFSGQPLPGADGWQGAEDRHQFPIPPDLHPEHGEPALFTEEGAPLHESCNLF